MCLNKAGVEETEVAFTCEVQTLLNVTNAAVCTNQTKGSRSIFRGFVRINPTPSAAPICGTKLANGDRTTLLQNDRPFNSERYVE